MKNWRYPGGIIILHKCTKNHDHKLYCSLDMERNRFNYYFSFWAVCCPFISLTARKIKLQKKMKKTPGDIIILHKCTKNHDHMLYCSWGMAHDRCNCYFSLSAIFCPFTTAQKIKIKKKKMNKAPGDIIILHMCTKNCNQMMYSSWDMLCDRWTDRWKKWHIEVDAPPKSSKVKCTS